MYPVLFEIFGYQATSFGVLLALAFLVGLWITSVRMAELGLDPDKASTMLVYMVVGGLGGSKLYFAIDVWLREGEPFLSLLLSREGITFYGGLIGAFVVGAVGCRIHGLPIKAFADAGCIAVAVGQAIGRVGCFLNGDDYGRVTDVPWAVTFPEGSPPTLTPVHPTMLYEAAWLVPVAAFLWWRRDQSPFLFGEFIALNGLGRFVIEFWRVNPPLALGLTQPQWIGIGLIVTGVVGLLYYNGRPAPASAP